jgi:hypothetical protein
VGGKGGGGVRGGEINQALYAHMNNKRKMKKKKRRQIEQVHRKTSCHHKWHFAYRISQTSYNDAK